jgi:hypothetical protein
MVASDQMKQLILTITKYFQITKKQKPYKVKEFSGVRNWGSE